MDVPWIQFLVLNVVSFAIAFVGALLGAYVGFRRLRALGQPQEPTVEIGGVTMPQSHEPFRQPDGTLGVGVPPHRPVDYERRG